MFTPEKEENLVILVYLNKQLQPLNHAKCMIKRRNKLYFYFSISAFFTLHSVHFWLMPHGRTIPLPQSVSTTDYKVHRTDYKVYSKTSNFNTNITLFTRKEMRPSSYIFFDTFVRKCSRFFVKKSSLKGNQKKQQICTCIPLVLERFEVRFYTNKINK